MNMQLYADSVNRPAIAMRNPDLVWACSPSRITATNATCLGTSESWAGDDTSMKRQG